MIIYYLLKIVNMNNNFVWGLVIGIMLIFFLLETRDRCYLKPDNTFNEILQILVRQAARWTTAAEQDENSMIAVLHANYGAGYLWAVKDIATPAQIKSATGVDVQRLTNHIVKVQDLTTKRMAKLCPKYAPPPTFLTKLGGEG